MAKEEKKEFAITDLPGVGAATAEKLELSGYDNLMSIAVASPAEMVEVAGVTEAAAKKIIATARQKLDMGFESGEELLKRREQIIKIKTGCKAFDEMIGGGFESGGISECFGEFGSSKSQIAHVLAVTAQTYVDSEGNPGKVIFIDGEGTFRPERIKSIAEARGMDTTEVLKNIKVARAFNSVLGSEEVLITNDNNFHRVPIEDVVNNRQDKNIHAFSFDPENGLIKKARVTKLIKHKLGENNLMYKISTKYGREVTVTGSHSLFKGVRFGLRGDPIKKRLKGNMKPVDEYASFLRKGDYVALPRKLNLEEKDIHVKNIVKEFYSKKTFLDEIVVIDNNGKESLLLDCENSDTIKYLKLRKTGKRKQINIPNLIEVTDELLWLFGLILAEGDSQYRKRLVRLRITSEKIYIEKARKIIKDLFGIESFIHGENRAAPTLLIPSRLFCLILRHIFNLPIHKLAVMKRIPEWIFGLPLGRIKHFIKGYWDGDGYHKNQPSRKLIIATSSKYMANDLSLLFLRFGIVASLYKFKIPNKKEHWYQPYRVEASGLNINNPLMLDSVEQDLSAPTWNDLVFAQIKDIEVLKLDPNTDIYDFEVYSEETPFQNFIGGFGNVCCHNSDHQTLLAEKTEDIIKKEKNVRLIIVDSLTSHFRADFTGRGQLADRQQKINKHMHTLMKLANQYNIVVYVTNQVMAKPDTFFGDPTAAIGGNIVSHNSQTRVYLRKGKKGTRVGKLVDSPHLPDSECIFQITDKGIEDV